MWEILKPQQSKQVIVGNIYSRLTKQTTFLDFFLNPAYALENLFGTKKFSLICNFYRTFPEFS